MKKSLLAALILCWALLHASVAFAVPLVASADLLEQAIALFPERSGPFDLRYRSDLRMREAGFEIVTYTFLAGAGEAGYVTRVTSLAPPDAEGYYDLLLRFDDKGRVAGSVNLAGGGKGARSPATGEAPQPPGGADVEVFLRYLRGKNPAEFREPLTLLINGLAMGATLRELEPPPPPPKDFVLDTTGQILLPGVPIPALKTKDLQGKPLSTETMKGKVVMVFTTPTCEVCDEMIQALERGLELSRKRGSVDLVYVVGADAAETRKYLARVKAKGTGVADPDDAVSKAFQAPFRPYILMFEDGVLKFNFVWEDDESRLYGLLYLLIEGNEPEGEDA